MSENSVVVTRTRSGRVSKPPVRYVPVEQVTDDYGEEDHDSDIDLDDSGSEFSEEDSEEETDDEDADENGNLAGFVVDEDPDEEVEAEDSDEEELLDSDED